jgi:hypothetical protein
MPDPGEPWSSDPDYQALARELRAERATPQPEDYASFPDYLLAIDAYVRRMLARQVTPELTEKDVRRKAIELQIAADQITREAAQG